MSPFPFNMPSILNTPANEIPIHFFRLPVAQREILLVNVLTDPVLYEFIIASPHYCDDPTFQQAIVLFRNYTLIRQLFARLAVPHLPIQITEAFDPALTAARTSVLVLLVDWGLDRLLGTLPRDHLASILRTVILSLSEGQRQAYYCSDDAVEGTVQEEEDYRPPPPLAEPRSPAQLRLPHPLTRSPPPTLQSTHSPSWLVEQTPFPLAEQTPFPLGSVTGGMLLQLKEVGLKLTEEELRQWALDALLSLEDWKWLWELPVPVPIQLTSPIPPLPHLPWYNASSAGPLTTFAPNVPNTSAPFVDWPCPDILNEPVPCAPVPYVESLVMWAPVAQPQPLHVHPPPDWLTDGMLESESREYGRGNVTIEYVPIPFSPFSATDCTMLNHFSFEDFIAIAFPDLAGDLDIQI